MTQLITRVFAEKRLGLPGLLKMYPEIYDLSSSFETLRTIEAGYFQRQDFRYIDPQILFLISRRTGIHIRIFVVVIILN